METLTYAKPIPLTDEEAYWHACTGTPWEQKYGPPMPLYWDSQIQVGDWLVDAQKIVKTGMSFIPVNPRRF